MCLELVQWSRALVYILRAELRGREEREKKEEREEKEEKEEKDRDKETKRERDRGRERHRERERDRGERELTLTDVRIKNQINNINVSTY